MNNYDQSSTGVSVEAYVFFDTSLGQENFCECFSRVGKDVFLYTDFGNLSDEYDWDRDVIVEDTHENWVKLVKYLVKSNNNRYSYLKEYSIYYILYNLHHGENYAVDEIREILDEAGIAWGSDYYEFHSKGYSQGDSVDILVDVVAWEKVMGAPFDLSSEKFIKPIFWDAPMSVRIVVNGEEYYSELDGQYKIWGEVEYDKDTVVKEFLEMISEVDQQILKEQLEAVLPECPEYE